MAKECNYPIRPGWRCGNIVRRGKNKCWMHDGTPKKSERLQAKNERLKKALERIQTWARAYPLDIFQKPDLKKAAEVLKAAGMTLDAISADSMRHVLDGVKDIVMQALSEDKDDGSV